MISIDNLENRQDNPKNFKKNVSRYQRNFNFLLFFQIFSNFLNFLKILRFLILILSNSCSTRHISYLVWHGFSLARLTKIHLIRVIVTLLICLNCVIFFEICSWHSNWYSGYTCKYFHVLSVSFLPMYLWINRVNRKQCAYRHLHPAQ